MPLIRTYQLPSSWHNELRNDISPDNITSFQQIQAVKLTEHSPSNFSNAILNKQQEILKTIMGQDGDVFGHNSENYCINKEWKMIQSSTNAGHSAENADHSAENADHNAETYCSKREQQIQSTTKQNRSDDCDMYRAMGLIARRIHLYFSGMELHICNVE
jgi:hypothetical protein